MSQHLMTVCVFCLLCATHTSCSAHTEVSQNRDEISRFKDGLIDPNRLHLPDNGRTVQYNSINNSDFHLKELEVKNNSLYDNINTSNHENNSIHRQNTSNFNLQNLSEIVSTVLKTDKVQDRSNNLSNEIKQIISNNQISRNSEENSQSTHQTLHRHKRVRRSVPQDEEDHKRQLVASFDDQYYIKKLFTFFGDGEVMTLEGFEEMIKHMGLHKMVEHNSNKSNISCASSEELLIPQESHHDDHHDHHDHEGHGHHRHRREVRDHKNETISPEVFKHVCPLLVYQMSAQKSVEREGCVEPPPMFKHVAEHEKERNLADVQIWLYACLSIIIISACGLLGVAVIPFMKKRFYHQLLQFLVALAVGTLCGDALLHLLPHAMMPPHSHPVSEQAMSKELELHNTNMWKGFVAMSGVIFFFFMEKFLTLGAELRKRRQKKHKLPTKVRVMRDTDSVGNNSVGEKLCKHKYSSYPYCYDEIATEMQAHGDVKDEDDNNSQNGLCTVEKCETIQKLYDHHNRNQNKSTTNPSLDSSHNNTNMTTLNEGDSDSETTSFRKSCSSHLNKNEANQNEYTANSKNAKPVDGFLEIDGGNKVAQNDTVVINDVLPKNDLQLSEEESYTVILREHESRHHGHSHTHGHVHSAPKSMSSVAWMVIMGDGLHNFTDGMAIGAAFASGIAGGFSTSVAVFCHELPHEIGDFAVLLKAGMSAKQAVFYNLLSSVLCFFGCLLGVGLGHNEVVSGWIFSIAAGMFIYIALVDMIPELTSSHPKEGGSLLQCMLQFLGLSAGLGVMTLIALYEHDLKQLFGDDH